jgi:hypothetical protein
MKMRATVGPPAVKSTVSDDTVDEPRVGRDGKTRRLPKINEMPAEIGRQITKANVAPPDDGDRDDGFSWKADNPDLVVPMQPATAIYLNPYGQVVIRQESPLYERDDPFVMFNVEYLPVLIARLQSFQKRR